MEGGVEVSKEGVLAAKSEQPLLDHRGLDIIVLQYNVLLQSLDRDILPTACQFSQEDLCTIPSLHNKIRGWCKSSAWRITTIQWQCAHLLALFYTGLQL